MPRKGMHNIVSTERATSVSLACAPAACVAFAVLYIVAAMEDPSYRVFDNYLSDLGIGPGAWAFNFGAAVAGCLLAVFAAGGVRSYFRDNPVTMMGALLLFVSGVFLAGVGVFTEDTGDTHLVVSYGFFVSAFISLAVLAIGTMRSVKKLADAFIIVSVATFSTGVAAVVASGPDPFAETIAVFALLAWGTIAPLAIAIRHRHGREM